MGSTSKGDNLPRGKRAPWRRLLLLLSSSFLSDMQEQNCSLRAGQTWAKCSRNGHGKNNGEDRTLNTQCPRLKERQRQQQRRTSNIEHRMFKAQVNGNGRIDRAFPLSLGRSMFNVGHSLLRLCRETDVGGVEGGGRTGRRADRPPTPKIEDGKAGL